MQTLLKEMGVTLHEPRVINQMLDFVYSELWKLVIILLEVFVKIIIFLTDVKLNLIGYVTNVVEEARVYSTYAKKKSIDADDVRLAVKMVSNKSFSTVPPREVLMNLLIQKHLQYIKIRGHANWIFSLFLKDAIGFGEG